MYTKIYQTKRNKEITTILIQNTSGEFGILKKWIPTKEDPKTENNLEFKKLNKKQLHSDLQFDNDMSNRVKENGQIDLEFYNSNSINTLVEDRLQNIECKYFDCSSFKSLFATKKYFSFLHVNISSLPKHIDNLLSLLDDLEHNFKVIGLSETRLVESKMYPDLNIDGYKFLSLIHI